MKVPMADLPAQYRSIQQEMDAALKGVIETSAFIGGPFRKSFEENFARYTGATFCVGVGNGTDALFITLKGLGLKSGDEVITAANSFVATSEAITMTGARVRFVDCHPETYNLDPAQIEAAITPNTRVILPVHLYGQPADMDAINATAEKHNLAVVEDAAQAHGGKYRGRNVGTLSNAACFSFFPGKNLGAFGDAGGITTSDQDLEHRIRMFSNHGRMGKYDHEFEGVNSRLDGLQAAVLDVKLRHLETWTERRRFVAARYDEAFKDCVRTPYVLPQMRHVYHQYVIQVEDRERTQKHLADHGVSTGVHYPIPLPFLKAYAYLGHRPEDFPVASSLKDRILSLPVFGEMTDPQLDHVIEQVKQAIQS